jgi:hypothetical protein
MEQLPLETSTVGVAAGVAAASEYDGSVDEQPSFADDKQ